MICSTPAKKKFRYLWPLFVCRQAVQSTARYQVRMGYTFSYWKAKLTFDQCAMFTSPCQEFAREAGGLGVCHATVDGCPLSGIVSFNAQGFRRLFLVRGWEGSRSA